MKIEKLPREYGYRFFKEDDSTHARENSLCYDKERKYYYLSGMDVEVGDGWVRTAIFDNDYQKIILEKVKRYSSKRHAELFRLHLEGLQYPRL